MSTPLRWPGRGNSSSKMARSPRLTSEPMKYEITGRFEKCARSSGCLLEAPGREKSDLTPIIYFKEGPSENHYHNSRGSYF